MTVRTGNDMRCCTTMPPMQRGTRSGSTRRSWRSSGRKAAAVLCSTLTPSTGRNRREVRVIHFKPPCVMTYLSLVLDTYLLYLAPVSCAWHLSLVLGTRNHRHCVADFDEQTADDWDVDMEIYTDPYGGDKDAQDLMTMRTEKRRRKGITQPELDPNHIGQFEKHTKVRQSYLVLQVI